MVCWDILFLAWLILFKLCPVEMWKEFKLRCSATWIRRIQTENSQGRSQFMNQTYSSILCWRCQNQSNSVEECFFEPLELGRRRRWRKKSNVNQDNVGRERSGNQMHSGLSNLDNHTSNATSGFAPTKLTNKRRDKKMPREVSVLKNQ